jgi:hypothetical protein
VTSASLGRIAFIHGALDMTRPRAACAALAIALAGVAMPSGLRAQWTHIDLPATPRTADGKPDLSARAPMTADGRPDLGGIWQIVRPSRAPSGTGLTGLEYHVPEGFVFPFQPEAEKLFKHRRYDLVGAGRPSDHCLPHSVPDAMLPASPFKIVMTPGLTMILFEEFTQYRQIFTDGRGFPPDANPTWFGYSIGRWDRDTFVVESRGFNDRTWLDDSGHPHSDALHTIERFHRRNFGALDLDVTIDDPVSYTRPWTVSLHFGLLPDTELIENICENEKDTSHFVR